MADIAPELWAAIERDIRQSEDGDKRLQGLRKRLEQGANDYALANDYSALIGEHISEALQKNLVPGVLPDGKMYYNIAEKTVAPALELAHEQVTEFSAAVIEQIHRDAGMGIKAVKPPIDRDRVDGLVDKASSYDGMEDASWVLREPIKNFARHSADATAEANAEFVNGLGRQCYIVRMESRPCCKWCGRLAGRYEYPDTPKDVFRRHENCDCQVLYEDGDGYTDVHKKKKVADPAKRQREIEAKHQVKGQTAGGKTGRALEKVIEQRSREEKVITPDLVIEGHTSIPREYTPNSVIDRVDDNGKTVVRSFYDADGKKAKDIHTDDHGNPKNHAYGMHGEHAHEYEWEADGKLKNKVGRELTREERERNKDILEQ